MTHSLSASLWLTITESNWVTDSLTQSLTWPLRLAVTVRWVSDWLSSEYPWWIGHSHSHTWYTRSIGDWLVIVSVTECDCDCESAVTQSHSQCHWVSPTTHVTDNDWQTSELSQSVSSGWLTHVTEAELHCTTSTTTVTVTELVTGLLSESVSQILNLKYSNSHTHMIYWITHWVTYWGTCHYN